jgi:hypothetical protein
MKTNGNNIIFSTGKVRYANNGIIGLSEPDKEYGWTIFDGYDGRIEHNNLTRSEINELADYMINLWQRFKKDKI